MAPQKVDSNKDGHNKALWRKDAPADFTYTDEPEPHALRRKEIIKKYPEIEKLYKHDPLSALFGLGTLVVQFTMIWLMSTQNWLTIIFCAYFIGGFMNHSMILGCHELSHDLWFPKRWQNQWYGYVMNLTTGVAFFRTFKRYHLEHHSFQGSDKWDVDIPSRQEGLIFNTRLTKFIFVFFSWVPYAIRPILTRPKEFIADECVNWIINLTSDATVFYLFGFKGLAYMLLSTILGLGFHPMSGHFIAEHYEFIKGQETYSYYGPLNYLTYNVGYHNEHHDFPRVPGRLLPKVKEIAPEYYDLPSYSSWCLVLWAFVMNPNVTAFCRIKRDP